MRKADSLIRTKLYVPFTRPDLVPRPRLQACVTAGLRYPLTLLTAPAGFGKTTLLASCIVDQKTPVAWLSIDKEDNLAERFLKYLLAALQQADNSIGNEAARLFEESPQTYFETVLTLLINDLLSFPGEMTLVLDDYQFISSQAVHEILTFLLEHCPKTFHLVIATRSDPPLPLARLRARGQMVELRTADLRFTEAEAAQFLNKVMGLDLETEFVRALEERTEGWIAGLQMAALSMRDREDVAGFIEGFSGTNRYILDYLLEEVLASQSPEVQRFLLCTSILERLSAPLCNAILANEEDIAHQSDSILEYLEKANLFLIPLDEKRTWFRFHRLFADLLHAQLQKSLGVQGVAQLHIYASDWYAQNGSIVEAINHASQASDDERVERFIEQNYMELVDRGEQSWLRFWTGRLSKELVYRKPWLCIYEAYSHSWFGELDEADRLLEEAEKRTDAGISAPDGNSMLAHLSYVKSRVAAMRGDLPQAIAYCLAARQYAPASNLALQLDTRITLGYEYFLNGDYANANPILEETIRLGISARAVINTVAASCILARLYEVQGLLTKSHDTYQFAAKSIPEASGQHLGAKALWEVGIAEVLYEQNDLVAALIHIKQGLTLLPWWDKADDWALAYITLSRIHLAQANRVEAEEAVRKAFKFVQNRGVFSEACQAVKVAQVRLWLAQGDLVAANHWLATKENHFGSNDPFRFENEVTQIAQARIMITMNKPNEAISLLSHLQETAKSAGRRGRVIEILLLQLLARQELGDFDYALRLLTKCLKMAEPEGYVRVFLDEGQPMRLLLVQWVAHADSGILRDYAVRLLAAFDSELVISPPQVNPLSSSNLVELLSQREIEVLQIMALGKTNQEIARQLIVSPGTVKAHTASIYRKLDVANRTEAVARARMLGILS